MMMIVTMNHHHSPIYVYKIIWKPQDVVNTYLLEVNGKDHWTSPLHVNAVIILHLILSLSNGCSALGGW